MLFAPAEQFILTPLDPRSRPLTSSMSHLDQIYTVEKTVVCFDNTVFTAWSGTLRLLLTRCVHIGFSARTCTAHTPSRKDMVQFLVCFGRL